MIAGAGFAGESGRGVERGPEGEGLGGELGEAAIDAGKGGLLAEDGEGLAEGRADGGAGDGDADGLGDAAHAAVVLGGLFKDGVDDRGVEGVECGEAGADVAEDAEAGVVVGGEVFGDGGGVEEVVGVEGEEGAGANGIAEGLGAGLDGAGEPEPAGVWRRVCRRPVSGVRA